MHKLNMVIHLGQRITRDRQLTAWCTFLHATQFDLALAHPWLWHGYYTTYMLSFKYDNWKEILIWLPAHSAIFMNKAKAFPSPIPNKIYSQPSFHMIEWNNTKLQHWANNFPINTYLVGVFPKWEYISKPTFNSPWIPQWFWCWLLSHFSTPPLFLTTFGMKRRQIITINWRKEYKVSNQQQGNGQLHRKVVVLWW